VSGKNLTAGTFAASRERFETLVGWLDGTDAAGLTHAELEARLDADGRQLLCQLLQDHLDLRAHRERRVAVIDAEGVTHGAVEADHPRSLATIVGEVTVTRLAYRRRGHPNLYAADAALNLPAEKHSHGLRRLAATEAARGSFDDAVTAIGRASGQRLGKRQVEQLAVRAAVDFDAFYSHRQPPPADATDVLVLSVDGKGIVMRPPALREPTARAATSAKLATRLSKGEKRNRKRMATVAAVYDLTPARRRPTDIIAVPGQPRAPAPVAHNKWLCASVREDAATVIARAFDEAERRDPDRTRPWVVLVDGNNHQIEQITRQARARRRPVRIVIDFVHVLEYLWAAAWSFHDEGDPAAETWVADKALAVLNSKASTVAAAIRRKITYHQLDAARAANAHRCADYLTNKQSHLGYAITLAFGYPIATGVIEGACRHLVKDRLDITGARWGLDGAEAVLRLRALHSNGDIDEYWRYHLDQEQRRVHLHRYADSALPAAA
jgi:hypothetical protein